MKRKVFFSALTLLFLFIVAVSPAYADRKPDWVDGPSLRYPDTDFLTGVGTGDSRASAERSAYAALARIFRSRIHSTMQEKESFRQREADGQRAIITRKVDIENRTAVSTNMALEQIRMVERWLDPSTKVHHALAILNRSEAAMAFRQKSLSAETEARVWDNRAKHATNPLVKAKALGKAISAARLIDQYEESLRVIDQEMVNNATHFGYTASLEDRLSRLLGQHFQVAVEVTGPHAPDVQLALLEGLHQEGFVSGPGANLKIIGSTEFTAVGPKDPVWYYVRWTAHITMEHQPSGQVFGTIRRSGREAQLSPEEAEVKALTSLQSDLSTTIGEAVYRFIFDEQ